MNLFSGSFVKQLSFCFLPYVSRLFDDVKLVLQRRSEKPNSVFNYDV